MGEASDQLGSRMEVSILIFCAQDETVEKKIYLRSVLTRKRVEGRVMTSYLLRLRITIPTLGYRRTGPARTINNPPPSLDPPPKSSSKIFISPLRLLLAVTRELVGMRQFRKLDPPRDQTLAKIFKSPGGLVGASAISEHPSIKCHLSFFLTLTLFKTLFSFPP